jgi:predicted Zn-dependent protease with MMP-like domain
MPPDADDGPRRRRYKRRLPGPRDDGGSDGPSATVERYVQEALSELPPAYAERIENVVFVVRREPGRRERASLGLRAGQELYGLYQGLPLTVRGTGYGLPGYHMAMPDRISIFWLPLVRDFEDNGRLRRQVKKTVFHEIAHYFGMSDDDLRGTSVR